MGSARRRRLWLYPNLLAASLCLFFVVTPAEALAAGADETSQPASSNATDQSSGSEDAAPPDTDAAEEPVVTDGPASAPDEPTSEEPGEDPSASADSTIEEGPWSQERPATDEFVEPSVTAGLVEAGADPDKGDVAEPLPVEPKVTICHATRDRTNPYNQITVTIPQAVGHAALHEGPIFAPRGPPASWGDIIPPIPGLPGGQNWPEGREILDDGCEMEPDSGPLPDAVIGQVECDGATPTLEVTLSNDPDATEAAFFTVLVDGDVVHASGPIAPGDSETVTITGQALLTRENQTFTVDVRSGGEVIASEVVSVDCDPPPPPGVEITAELLCGEGGAEGSLAVTNNGPDPVTVTATVNGEPLGQPLVVGQGATETSVADLSQFEDQTITIQILVDGEILVTYSPTPDCELTAVPGVKIAGLECSPPSTTVTLSNGGDPESTVVFTILVNGEVAQESAPLFGGDTTTIVGDLAPYEDQTVTVEVRANDDVIGSRTIDVNCSEPPDADVAPAGVVGPDVTPGETRSSQVLPATGGGYSPGLIGSGLGMIVFGALLILASTRSGKRNRDMVS